MKRNKLYTVNPWNKDIFDTGDNTTPTSTVNPPATTPAPTSSGDASGAKGGDSSKWDKFVSDMGGMGNVMGMAQQANGILTQFGNWMAQGKTSTVGNIFNTLGSMGIPGMDFIGDIFNTVLGSKLNKENIAKFEKQNTMQGKSAFGASSDAEVLSNFANASALGDVAKKDVGSDGWFSRKAKKKTNAINATRQVSNAHNFAALNDSVSQLDFNKDFNLVSNFAAHGGPINRFDEGGAYDYSSFGDWWNKQGKTQYFGVWGDPKGANQARIARQQGYKTGKSGSQFGGANNIMSYTSAAQDIIGNITHWGDEDYVKSKLGSNGGEAIGTTFAIANLIAEKAKGERQSLEDNIGLAEGGPVNKFAMGGSDYSQIATSVANLANNTYTQAQTKDITDIQSELRRRGNIDFTGNTNADLLSSWNNNYRAYNSEGITDMDIRNKSWAEDTINGIQAGSEGAVTGFKVGGVPGAIIGSIIGTGSSIIGTAIGRSKAKKKRKQLTRDIDTTNAREIATFDVMKGNLDRSNDINAKALDFAFGGPFATQQPMMIAMPIPMGMPNQSSSGAVNYQMSSDLVGLGKQRAMDAAASPTNVSFRNSAIKELKTFSEGGGIHINPKNRGKFNETKRRTGKTTEELTHSKNPLTRKRAIFAQNAAKWHHANGGYVQGGTYDLDEAEIQRLIDAGYQIQYE